MVDLGLGLDLERLVGIIPWNSWRGCQSTRHHELNLTITTTIQLQLQPQNLIVYTIISSH